MKGVRLDTWVCQLQPPRNPRLLQRCSISQHSRPASRSTRPQQTPHQPWCHRRGYATVKRTSSDATPADQIAQRIEIAPRVKERKPILLHIKGNPQTAKLSALHARLALPAKLPLQTLARCLLDASADPNPIRNNASMAVLGQDLLAYYTSEHLITTYPRLPLAILFAAQYAYSGPAVLSAIRAEWGVETAASPGVEVDRALLQYTKLEPGKALAQDGVTQIQDHLSLQRMGEKKAERRRGLSGRIVLDDEFGEPYESRPYAGAPITTSSNPESQEKVQTKKDSVGIDTTQPKGKKARQALLPPIEQRFGTSPVTTEQAGATFIRALTGAIYLHAGDEAVKKFHREHILSRHLELHKLFHFNAAPRDITRLCAREGFEPPVARLLSETGRLSRTPVFVVGIYSGNDKLGEAAGASLTEARVRAAAAALRAWYLYSPPIDNVMRPSDMEAPEPPKRWIPQLVDPGEIIS